MTIPKFIEKAIEGGWHWPWSFSIEEYKTEYRDDYSWIFLDPLAWKAVGKVGGFKDERYCASGAGCEWDNQSNHEFACVWKYSKPNPEHLAVGMISALFEEKTIEQYLETL